MNDLPKRKLIEVALPLEAINRESSREKSIHRGHPSSLHLWWARRPLAAARAILFAQLVDDPSARPDEFPTEEDQNRERHRLFKLLEQLSVWENRNDLNLFAQAKKEILTSSGGELPQIMDPFAGGGSIPLEAQRLGLPVEASDLNPVAVLINKALIEIPSKWAGQSPRYPAASEMRLGVWPGSSGLAEDVLRYGEWVCKQAESRLATNYPPATLSDGSKATIIAWLWARSVRCPNPACRVEVPLVNSFTVSKRRGHEAHVVPTLVDGRITFKIEHTAVATYGPTVSRTGALCVACGAAMPLAYVRAEGRAGRLGSQLMSIVAEGTRQRVYLEPDDLHTVAAAVPAPQRVPNVALPDKALGFRVQAYGVDSHDKLYTRRQLVLLDTIVELIGEARSKCIADSGSIAYGDDIAIYLTLLLGRIANRSSSQSFWDPGPGKIQQVFARNALPMIWVYAEGNPFSSSSGNAFGQLTYLVDALAGVPACGTAEARQMDAATLSAPGRVFITDPPYYDNVPYADLSDFFYVWHRMVLRDILPDLYGTVVTPKSAELIAEPARNGSRAAAARFFENGLSKVFDRLVRDQDPRFPFTVFYAFKQSESTESGVASTGWETMLEALLGAGAMIVATWPVRTELAGGLRELGRNALASSVVLVCRPLSTTAEACTRRNFLAALKTELPVALKELQLSSIAPVDLTQAAIGPGMRIFSRYAKVVEADGSNMRVRTALAHINQVLDQVLAAQEGDFDSDTRFCVKWFSEFGWNEASSGQADVLSRATNTSVEGLVRGGVFRAVAGKARLVDPEALSLKWDPRTDVRLSDWEVAVRLARELSAEGVDKAAYLMGIAGERCDLDTTKELTYLLFSIAEKRGWTDTAILFNGLGTAWNDLVAKSRLGLGSVPSQSAFDLGGFEN